MAREGQTQLGLWISNASMARLKALATEQRQTLREIVEAAIAGYRPDPVDAMPGLADRVAALESRIDALECRIDSELDKQLDSPLDSEPDELNATINELARQGMKQTAIASALNERGYRTANGKPFDRGNSRIARVIKAVSQTLDSD